MNIGQIRQNHTKYIRLRKIVILVIRNENYKEPMSCTWAKNKDCQGLVLPPGVRGKGIKGRGQGTQLVTPEKPLPLPGFSYLTFEQI